MKNDNRNKLIQLTYNGYIEMSLYNEEKDKFIIVGEDTFDEECREENGEINYDLKEKMQNELAKVFENNGYSIYVQGGHYVNKYGNLEAVNAETAFIAIKD